MELSRQAPSLPGCSSGELFRPHVVSIAYTPEGVERRPGDRYARLTQERVALLQGRGIEGDVKSRGGRRQLNVLTAEDVAWLRGQGFRAAPGELGEQLVIAGLEAGVLAVGARLRLGDSAVIEVTEARTPCGRFASVQGQPKEAANGRLGFMARVLRGGEIRVGATVERAPEADGGKRPAHPSQVGRQESNP